MSYSNNGQEALELLQDRNDKTEPLPSIILMDLNMPGLSGVETTEEIRRRYRGAFLPIVAVSGEDNI
eukprot:scaffold274487_cov47-Prasinocladus_malaysianus.AAC.1